ncbi:MAG TPA: OmpA family protein [Vicinamibacterales bacterium]|nr:OmpA family protein [Vicinamibacterales bacterium]
MYRDSVRITSWVLAAGALSLAVACSKKQPPVVATPPMPPPVVVQQTPPPQPPPPQPPPPPEVVVSTNPTMTEDEVFAKWTLDDLNGKRPLDDVLFEYDSAELTEAGRATLQKNTAWLQRWITTKVTVEGHADSRGTNEYNFALSERRAASVRDYLVSLGVSSSRVAIVSKGEEQPVCTDETTDCWARNRRGHFIFTAK